jgi:hypothetical protein
MDTAAGQPLQFHQSSLVEVGGEDRRSYGTIQEQIQREAVGLDGKIVEFPDLKPDISRINNHCSYSLTV